MLRLTSSSSNVIRATGRVLLRPSMRPRFVARVSAEDKERQSSGTIKTAIKTASDAQSGLKYYQGLLTTDMREDNGSSSQEMLSRNLKLAGGVAGFLVLLVVGFLASNGLL
jgi:hypothetical protein